jgi:hypothetical protein
MKTVLSMKHIVEAQVALVKDYMDDKVDESEFKFRATALQAQRDARQAELDKRSDRKAERTEAEKREHHRKLAGLVEAQWSDYPT